MWPWMQSFLWDVYDSQKCKSALTAASIRLKHLITKEEHNLLKLRAEVEKMLSSDQSQMAHIKTEELLKLRQSVGAYEITKGLCESLVHRLELIQLSETCPNDIRECVVSTAYAAFHFRDVVELSTFADQMTLKFGAAFVTDSFENQNNEVLPELVEKLSFSHTGIGDEKIAEEMEKISRKLWGAMSYPGLQNSGLGEHMIPGSSHVAVASWQDNNFNVNNNGGSDSSRNNNNGDIDNKNSSGNRNNNSNNNNNNHISNSNNNSNNNNDNNNSNYNIDSNYSNKSNYNDSSNYNKNNNSNINSSHSRSDGGGGMRDSPVTSSYLSYVPSSSPAFYSSKLTEERNDVSNSDFNKVDVQETGVEKGDINVRHLDGDGAEIGGSSGLVHFSATDNPSLYPNRVHKLDHHSAEKEGGNENVDHVDNVDNVDNVDKQDNVSSGQQDDSDEVLNGETHESGTGNQLPDSSEDDAFSYATLVGMLNKRK